MPPKTNSKEAVKVAVRLRPMSEKEIAAGFKKIVEIDKSTATVKVMNPQGQPITFTFDYGYPDNTSQEVVYEETASPIVEGVLEGFNGTIFAYGQTGTGKTYSMDGKNHGEHRGIMPRAFDHIFEYIDANSDSHEFLVTITYVEIYNDVLRDLLSENHEQALKIREDPTNGVQIKGVAVHKVKCVDELHALLAYGKKNRVVRKTNMNAESSRSHSILTLNIETLTKIDGQDHVRKARLNLVDLAGSERVAKTGAEGVGFQEGVNINYELMVLGNCIAALTAKGNTHVPYRDSKLTMLLRDSLGGNARTMMIAALGPADYNFSETMSTLRYAERAKKIENKPKVNMDPKDALLLKLKEELAELEQKVNQKNQLNAEMGASEEAIEAMEQNLNEQRAELANAANMAAKERDELNKKVEETRKDIERERNKREQYQNKLKELEEVLSKSDKSDLLAKTVRNEAALKQAKEKLRQREEKARKLQAEMEERRKKREAVAAQLSSLEENVGNIRAIYDKELAEYKNLRVMLPEINKTIQEDREELATNLHQLEQDLDFYTQIVENFIPEGEVNKIKSTAEYNEDTISWSIPSMDKKRLAKEVLSFEKPKSALGRIRPTANAQGQAAAKLNEDTIDIPLNPLPIQDRVKQGPSVISMRNIPRAIEAAFAESVPDIVIDF